MTNEYPMTNDQCPTRPNTGPRRLWTVVIGTWSFIGYWSLNIGHCVLLFTMASPQRGLAAASFIYHERSTRSALEGASAPDCPDGQPYVEILSPALDQPAVLRFRIEYHLATDQARVYYTIDGTDPAGSLGNGSNSTRVAVADYSCTTIADPNVLDICRAVIPGQAPGTTVK